MGLYTLYLGSAYYQKDFCVWDFGGLFSGGLIMIFIIFFWGGGGLLSEFYHMLHLATFCATCLATKLQYKSMVAKL